MRTTALDDVVERGDGAVQRVQQPKLSRVRAVELDIAGLALVATRRQLPLPRGDAGQHALQAAHQKWCCRPVQHWRHVIVANDHLSVGLPHQLGHANRGEAVLQLTAEKHAQIGACELDLLRRAARVQIGDTVRFAHVAARADVLGAVFQKRRG